MFIQYIFKVLAQCNHSDWQTRGSDFGSSIEEEFDARGEASSFPRQSIRYKPHVNFFAKKSRRVSMTIVDDNRWKGRFNLGPLKMPIFWLKPVYERQHESAE